MQEILLFQGTVLQWPLAHSVREIAFKPVDHKRELYRQGAGWDPSKIEQKRPEIMWRRPLSQPGVRDRSGIMSQESWVKTVSGSGHHQFLHLKGIISCATSEGWLRISTTSNQNKVGQWSVPASGTQAGGWQSHSGQSTPLCPLSNRQPAFWFLVMTKTCLMRPACKDIYKHVMHTLSYLLFSFRVLSQDEICPILIS